MDDQARNELSRVVSEASRKVMSVPRKTTAERPPWDAPAVWFFGLMIMEAQLDVKAALELMFACEAQASRVTVTPEDVETVIKSGMEGEGEE